MHEIININLLDIEAPTEKNSKTATTKIILTVIGILLVLFLCIFSAIFIIPNTNIFKFENEIEEVINKFEKLEDTIEK